MEAPRNPPLNLLVARLTPLERNNTGGIELLLLDEPDPPFGQDVALAFVPVRVTEPSWLPVDPRSSRGFPYRC
ncbi:hypothetical protein RHMOL_Rhmol05G0174900 [Rhododendron molle]|uniref:Uncharacterized protein n=1 Tax=Rhododendron molle TaxID=49168 RepID=A0ACC0NQ00_RHOML|nr:hypothetical protein RHMOL_Rhmol05G0174900 [Rhododendron molle]